VRRARGGMQKVLWWLRWDKSEPMMPGAVRPTCRLMMGRQAG